MYRRLEADSAHEDEPVSRPLQQDKSVQRESPQQQEHLGQLERQHHNHQEQQKQLGQQHQRNGDGNSSPEATCENDDNFLIELIGYRSNTLKYILFYTGVLVTIGLMYLIIHWKPVWRVKLTKTLCPLKQADTLIVTDSQGHQRVEKIVVVDISDEMTTSYGTVGSLSSLQGMEEFIDRNRENGSTSSDRTLLTANEKLIVKYFDHRQVRHVWNVTTGSFVQLFGLDVGYTCRDICERRQGLTSQQSACRKKLYGSNSIHIEVKSYPRLFIEEVFNPFYVFQIFSVTVWYTDNYYVFATCIVLISLVSLSVELYETRKQRETLRDMVSSTETTVTVLQASGETKEVSATSLVPGDVVCLPSTGCLLTYDAVLLSGNAVVDEGMLTGESVPVTKSPLAPLSNDEVYSPDIHRRNTLFCGTHIIQTRFYADAQVKACVIRTGFATAKGELVRSILHPNNVVFKFYADSLKFVMVLSVMAIIGFIYIATFLILSHAHTKQIILQMLDIITVAVPPSLPAAMTVGIIYAQARLKKSGIFCISPPRINLSAKIQFFCFDKTGTLTEDGLDLLAVVPTKSSHFQEPIENVKLLDKGNRFALAMATCHSLTRINGELKGDPLDLKMFQAIGWTLEEPGEDRCKYDLVMPTVVRPPDSKPIIAIDHQFRAQDVQEVGIVRQFTFSSSLQRMSVIVRVLGANHMDVYAKGSPEQIVALCLPETVPKDFQSVLCSFTSKGLRVIGMAYKSLDRKVKWIQAQHISRTSVESDLRFLGLLVLENKLKLETIPVLQELNNANIRTVMVTGDNILTAASVARNCGLIESFSTLITVHGLLPEDGKPARLHWEPESLGQSQGENIFENDSMKCTVDIYQPCVRFAVAGRTFSVIERHFPELLERICLQGAVFARMSPDQKTKLIKVLQGLGLYVGMCGDGANDCGALRAAHTGISLSTAEASVASPFTSKIQNISCVPKLLKEGRAALVTSFCVFKFIALYSIIQFISVMILTSRGARLSDYMFLYIDLFISTAISLFMGQTGASDKLIKKRPPSSLVSAASICSLVTHTLLVICFQIGAMFYVQSQTWYESPEETDSSDERTHTYVSTVIFYNTCFQYLTMAFVLSRSHPYRQRIWKNVPFTLSLVVLTSISVLLVVHPPSIAQYIIKIIPLPSVIVRLTILGISAVHFLIAFLFENYLIENGVFTLIIRRLGYKKSKKSRHVVIREQLNSEPDWPLIDQTTFAKNEHGL